MNESKVTGGCLCGAVRYESDEAPLGGGYCHCKSCQKSTGGPFSVMAGFAPTKFRYISQEPTWYQSSKHVERSFCPSCGSSIGYRRDDREIVVVLVGTLDHPEAFEPKAHFFTNTKLPWVDIQPHLPDKTEELAAHKANASEG